MLVVRRASSAGGTRWVGGKAAVAGARPIPRRWQGRRRYTCVAVRPAAATAAAAPLKVAPATSISGSYSARSADAVAGGRAAHWAPRGNWRRGAGRGGGGDFLARPSASPAVASRGELGKRFISAGVQGSDRRTGTGGSARQTSPAGGSVDALTPGVAGVAGLHGPGDFGPLAEAAVEESDRLRKAISSGEVYSPIGILRGVDAISNTVCSVIDAADFVRNAHADEGFRDAADEAFSVLAEYIQELNADDSLYRALCGVVSEEGAMDDFSDEQRRVVMLHMAEFERGGIHLSGKERAEVVALQNEATRLERLFEHNILAKRAAFQVNRKDLSGVPEFILSRIPQPEGQPAELFTLLTDQSLMADVVKNARSGALRRVMYLAGNSVAAENVEVLERLMAVRHQLSLKVGFESHAHRMTSEKMAESPDEILRFLEALSAGIRDKAEQETNLLRKAKLEAEGSSELHAWDVSYYMGYVKSRECNLDGRSLSEYFTLGGCLGGLRMVCRGLFGISLEEARPRKHVDLSMSMRALENRGRFVSELKTRGS